MAADLGRGYHINRSNLLVLESKADMQKRGQASPDDGDALALTFAQPVAPAEVEEEDEEEAFGGTAAAAARGGCDETIWRVHGQSVTAMVEVAWMVNGLPSDRHGAEIPEKESREVRYFTGTNVDLNRAGSNGGRPAPLSRFERLVPGSRWHGAVGIEELARGCDQFPASSRRRGAVAGYLPDVTST